ncbi:MAG: hypothetical protein OXG94_02505 [Bacteroidetes bacterium]|nr:hypothetical protein [Bacteroidota bacterium]
MFSKSGRAGIGHIALGLPAAIRNAKLAPSVQAWDFAVIASAVAATDKAVLRSQSPDGWTRKIDLHVCLADPAVWNARRSELENMLRFLTGDFWSLRFRSGGIKPPKATKPEKKNADCVCLLSGGIDSLVGSIELTDSGMKPLFVSQVVRGDKNTQAKFASALGGSNRHYHWSFTAQHPGEPEKSTRARSIIFIAFAALAAGALQSPNNQTVETIVVPENGFISLNVPLGPGRLGTLSTKTTHPVFMSAVQSVWNAVGIQARLLYPYRFQTKGEMLQRCPDSEKLASLVGESTSCSRYQRYKLIHCGKCIPCLVRRAAFFEAQLPDTTAGGYLCDRLSRSESKDVIAAAVAYLRYQDEGIRRFVGSSVLFASHSERELYEGVVARGMDELGRLLSSHGVI